MEDVKRNARKGELLRDALVALERAGHRTCVLHGYEGYPEHIGSDVDTITEEPGQIPRTLAKQQAAAVVRASRHAMHYTEYRFVLCKQYEGEVVFLTYDASADYRLFGLRFFTGKEFLENRQPFKFFQVPSAELEFCGYLIRKIAKGSLSEARARRLTNLYRKDPTGCEHQLDRFFSETTSKLIADSARSGNWAPVSGRLDYMRRDLLKRQAQKQPLRWLAHHLAVSSRRLRRWFRALVHPPGLTVAFLGVDGAGKSTVLPQVAKDLSPIFNRTKLHHKRSFRSALNWTRRRRAGSRPQNHPSRTEKSTSTKHGAHRRPPRRFAGSLAKLLFWWLDYMLLGYVTDVYPSLVRSTLVLFDRYYYDLLVDAKRYRYGGPLWPVRLVGHLIPRPHLVILLDAPPEVLYARKQDAAPNEVRRFREAYLDLVEGLPNGHVVDAARPLNEVVVESERIILDYLAERTLRGFRKNKRR